MAVLGVYIEAGGCAKAEALADELGLPILKEKPDVLSSGVYLLVGDQGLELAFTNAKRGRPFRVDFNTPKFKKIRDRGTPRSHIFAKAMGKSGAESLVLDATMGWASDTVMLLGMGFHVHACEQSKVVVAMVKDAIQRAQSEDPAWVGFFSRLEIHAFEAGDFLEQSTQKWSAVYVDPMFVKPKTTSLSTKPIEFLKELQTGDASPDPDGTLIRDLAFVKSCKRAIVKQPLKARPSDKKPAHSFLGQSIRYDVFVNSP